ncbi:MAG: 1-acyl-sn-glycerol-3-phosphate acyltransferase [Simkaniaceae bacterium]
MTNEMDKIFFGSLPEKYKAIVEDFFEGYIKVIKSSGRSAVDYLPFFETFLELIKKQLQSPYEFGHFHKAIREPFDYYHFGIEFLRPLIDLEHSTVLGWENLAAIEHQLQEGHNVILLANHQIEADPQAISILIEKVHPKLAEEMIFVAGDRVTSDPLAVPFSLGRNLLCIYSKKYIDTPPEDKLKKQLHNKKTMETMSMLLEKGGKCIYVAPSGGRDRPDENGKVRIAAFDDKSIEMFYLMTKKSKSIAHFYPLALATYKILPPPQAIQVELGEQRKTEGGSIHLGVGKEMDMENFPGSEETDKGKKRRLRRDFIFKQVSGLYEKLTAKL